MTTKDILPPPEAQAAATESLQALYGKLAAIEAEYAALDWGHDDPLPAYDDDAGWRERAAQTSRLCKASLSIMLRRREVLAEIRRRIKAVTA